MSEQDLADTMGAYAEWRAAFDACKGEPCDCTGGAVVLAQEVPGLVTEVRQLRDERDKVVACIEAFVAGARLDGYQPMWNAVGGWCALCEIADPPPTQKASE